jgi:phosphohistidine swiveling domain-containing protein
MLRRMSTVDSVAYAVPSAVRGQPLVVPLTNAVNAPEVGGKASNLARLMALGVPVPDGFVITNSALRRFVEAGAFDPLLAELCRDLPSRSTTGLRCAAETIAALFAGESLPASVDVAVGDAWRAFDTSLAIVRSSAAGEDSDAASFAGQLDSIAGVCDEAELRRAIVGVWASQWSHRSLAYQVARGTPLAGMGVIVQRQIAAAVSGVLFTVAPRSASQMLLEYCDGSGEALVSGRVNPGRIAIARRGFAWSREAAPDSQVPHEVRLLNDRQLASLANMGLEIEAAFGCPQDIEWTMDAEGCVWVVQARPITVPAAGAGERTVSARDEVLWSNANVNENFPQPISPLLYSIAIAGYYHYFRNLGRAFGLSGRRLALMEQPLRQIIGVHGARMYYNLSSIHAVLRSAPFGDLLTASFNQFVGAGEVARAEEGGTFAEQARGRLSQCAEVAAIAFHTTRQYLFLTKRVERFEHTVAAFAERTHPDRLQTRSLPELLEDFRGFLDIRCNRWNDAALADAGSMVCYGLLQRLLARTFPDERQQSLHNTLLKALPDLVSGKPAVRLWELSRDIRADVELSRLFESSPAAEVLSQLAGSPRFAAFNTSLRRYLEDWGFRCSAELMLTTPSFQEDPAPVIDLLRSYAAMDGPSPADQLKRQESERLTETARVRRELRSRSLLPFVGLAPVVSIILAWTQRSIQLRERARLKQALLYSRLRRIACAIGARLLEQARLQQQDDVFFLTADEIDALLSGHAMFPDHVRALVALRRRGHAELSAMTPPDSMQLPRGGYLRVGAAPGLEREADGTAARLSGVGACGGRITGRAVVLTDVTESDRIARGDVLITRQTDPGWGPIFPLISGLVIERGGMLSHGAIIAREFGIPSVVGVKDATRLVPDGGLVTVDGDRGLVHLLQESPRC